MKQPARKNTCCFSGYRPEKISSALTDCTEIPDHLQQPLCDAIYAAYQDGYTHFLTGMSRGFDLWAAQAVLQLQQNLPLRLLCILPFSAQASNWPHAWQQVYHKVCMHADQVFTMSPQYYAGCYHARNRFLADASSHLICYYDGRSGGTRYTVQYAAANGLTMQNLADTQLSFYSLCTKTSRMQNGLPQD